MMKKPDNGVTIEGIPATATIEAGGKLGPVTATATGLDGLVFISHTKTGRACDRSTFLGQPASAPFEYTATVADAGKNLVFELDDR